jgi:hypothetical protein
VKTNCVFAFRWIEYQSKRHQERNRARFAQMTFDLTE